MQKCCYCGSTVNIEWNHALIYSGKQIDEWYAIVPLCASCHRGEFGTIRKEIKDYCSWLAITRGLPDLIKDYPRRDWLFEKNFYTKQFANVCFK